MGGSWAANAAEQAEWVAFARRLEGLTLDRVRYVNIDYLREQVAPDHTGVREISDEREWNEPTFAFPRGHTLDYGLELSDRDGHTWCITWIPPGNTEGLAIYEAPLIPDVVSPLGWTAVWDVSLRTDWRTTIGSTIDEVRPAYEVWDSSVRGYHVDPAKRATWCRRLELAIGDTTVEVLEAQGELDGSMAPSADNLVVRFNGGTV
jgi:hypothetical protein